MSLRWVSGLVVLAVSAIGAAQLLPAEGDLPKTLGEIDAQTGGSAKNFKVQKYVGNAGANKGPLNYKSDVKCNNKKIGKINFDYAAYTGDSGAGANNSGGMLIRGGFQFDALCTLKKGHKLRWLQTYIEVGGGNQSTVDGVPLYTDFTNPAYDAFLWDAPTDPFGANNISSILFESALVCFDEKDPKKLFVVGSFIWGYDVDNPNKTVKNEYAKLWTGNTTGTFNGIFDSEFGAKGTRDTGWSLTMGCDDCFQCVPEPGSICALSMGALVLLRRRKR